MENNCKNCSGSQVNHITGDWNCRKFQNNQAKKQESIKKLQLNDLKTIILFDYVVVFSKHSREEFRKICCRLENKEGNSLYELYGNHRILAMDLNEEDNSRVDILLGDVIGLE